MTIEGIMAAMDGRLEDAVAIAINLSSRGEQMGMVASANVMALIVGWAGLNYLGRLEVFDLFPSPFWESPVARLWIAPDVESAKTLDRWVVARPGMGSVEDETPAYFDIVFLQAALQVKHRKAAEMLLRRFAGCGLKATMLFPTCISRHLGAAAALLGSLEDARRHYDDALKAATEMRFRLELALTRLQLAELLLEHYPDEKADTLEHLDFAIKEFREMKIQPFPERALKLRPQKEP